MSYILFLVGLVCMAAISGCGDETQAVSRDDAIRYYLNQRNYDQAIGLLKEKLAQNKDDDVAKIQLASAYSGSVGINTVDCFEVLKPKLFDQPVGGKTSSAPFSFSSSFQKTMAADPAANPSSREEKQRHAIRAVEKELLKFASQASDALDIAFRLPHTPVKDRNRIMLSMSLLADIDESSTQYLTAQLYQGILATVQFVNYLRDAVPPSVEADRGSKKWYLSLYCQLDLGVFMPNLSRSVDFLTVAFTSLANAGRRSENPVYENLISSKTALAGANQMYLTSQDLFEFADWSMRASKLQVCQEQD